MGTANDNPKIKYLYFSNMRRGELKEKGGIVIGVRPVSHLSNHYDVTAAFCNVNDKFDKNIAKDIINTRFQNDAAWRVEDIVDIMTMLYNLITVFEPGKSWRKEITDYISCALKYGEPDTWYKNLVTVEASSIRVRDTRKITLGEFMKGKNK